MEEGNPVQY
jgi:hypothetical protein